MPTVTLAVEKLFPDLVEEIQPLWLDHYNELREFDADEIPLSPDYDSYKNLEEKEALLIITCRVDSELAGYFFWIISPHLHYKETIVANGDLYYISPKFRKIGLGRNLFAFAIDSCKKRGTKRIILGSKIKQNHGPLIQSFGFKHYENFYDLIL